MTLLDFYLKCRKKGMNPMDAAREVIYESGSRFYHDPALQKQIVELYEKAAKTSKRKNPGEGYESKGYEWTLKYLRVHPEADSNKAVGKGWLLFLKTKGHGFRATEAMREQFYEGGEAGYHHWIKGRVNPGDPTEGERRRLSAELNAIKDGRTALEKEHGQVWDTTELSKEFEVTGFMAPFVVVRRKADGKKGTLMFQHSPRFYFSFTVDNPCGTKMKRFTTQEMTKTVKFLDLLSKKKLRLNLVNYLMKHFPHWSLKRASWALQMYRAYTEHYGLSNKRAVMMTSELNRGLHNNPCGGRHRRNPVMHHSCGECVHGRFIGGLYRCLEYKLVKSFYGEKNLYAWTKKYGIANTCKFFERVNNNPPRREWTYETAQRVAGNQPAWVLPNMKRALEMLGALNTPEENERLDAVKFLIAYNRSKKTRHNPRRKISGPKFGTPEWQEARLKEIVRKVRAGEYLDPMDEAFMYMQEQREKRVFGTTKLADWRNDIKESKLRHTLRTGSHRKFGPPHLNPHKPVLIGRRVKAVEYWDEKKAKAEGLQNPTMPWRHDYKQGGPVYGLPNGDVLIKAGKKKLWGYR